jgi:hypothetical protein
VSGRVAMVSGEWRRAAPAAAAYSHASRMWLAQASPVWQSVTWWSNTQQSKQRLVNHECGQAVWQNVQTLCTPRVHHDNAALSCPMMVYP